MSALREAFLVCLRVQAPDREGAVGAEARGAEGGNEQRGCVLRVRVRCAGEKGREGQREVRACAWACACVRVRAHACVDGVR